LVSASGTPSAMTATTLMVGCSSASIDDSKALQHQQTLKPYCPIGRGDIFPDKGQRHTNSEGKWQAVVQLPDLE
jgi:hypothetical protein